MLAVAAALLWIATNSIESHAAAVGRLVAPLRYHPALAHLASAGGLSPSRLPDTVPLDHVLRPGETLGALLGNLGVEGDENRSAVEAAGRLIDVRTLRSGDPYTVLQGPRGVVAVHLSVRDRGRLELVRRTDGWTGEFRPFSRHVELHAVRGTLDGGFEGSIRAAGGDPAVAYLMADVLQWDLDFNRDLRLGDEFEVLYERVFLDHRFDGLGRVVALTYSSGERQLSGFLYGEGDDYYDASGRPLQKMFLRSPLPYSRVTSHFSHRRFHPVLKTYRPHYGVDYGAPAGTPVRVTATGVVDRAGWETGGGRVVRVRHPNDYLTAYLHLSGFAEGIRSGARVRQGDVIGYVGSTGLATAAHLDYRVRLAGRWINPLSLENEQAQPIPAERTAEFEAWRDALLVSLREGRPRAELLTAMQPVEAGSDVIR